MYNLNYFLQAPFIILTISWIDSQIIAPLLSQAVEDSIKRDNGTVLVAFIDYRKKFDEDKHFIRSMHSALELCESNGAIICESIQDMAKIINGACKK